MPVKVKNLLVWCVCLAIGGGARAQPPAGTQAVQWVFDLSDGSRVIGSPSVDRIKMTTNNTEMEIPFSRVHAIVFSGANHDAEVNFQNGDSLSVGMVTKEIEVKTIFGQVVVPTSRLRQIRLGSAGGVFENSLGMKFVRVPGIGARFCIWPTRVRDYRAYVKADPTVNAEWEKPGFKQGEDCPVVNVNWMDAKAFCAWLTKKERREGSIDADQEYRLPTDEEWNAAVGPGKFPWGDDWPPPKGAKEYDNQSTFPVGTYAANAFGLYDMGTDVLQWCEGWYDDAQTYRLMRGISWRGVNGEEYAVSSFRESVVGDIRADCDGFRCVLAPVAASP